MVKQRASASTMRNGEDKGRFAVNSKGQAHISEASGNVAHKPQALARRAQQRLSTHYVGESQKTVLWELRCAELGLASWTRRIGPGDLYAMARVMAEALDHDLARIMAFGGKIYVLEMRVHGSERVTKVEICGFPVWKYSAKVLNS